MNEIRKNININYKLEYEKNRVEPKYTISGNPLLDFARIGGGYRIIGTSDEEYPRLVLTAFKSIREQYRIMGRPVSKKEWKAALDFYGVSEQPKPSE